MNPSQIKKSLYASIVTIIMLTILNVALSASVAQDGLMIDSLTKKQDSLQRDIAALEQSVMAKTSLADLSQKASELGYQKTAHVVALSGTPQTVSSAR